MIRNKSSRLSVLLVAFSSLLTPLALFAQDLTPPYEPNTENVFRAVGLFIPVFLILAALYVTNSVFRIKAENKIRQQLIEKGIPDDTLRLMLMNGNHRLRLESLKWGLITGCTGIGLLICRLYPFGFISFAILFISIAVALFIFYFLSQQHK